MKIKIKLFATLKDLCGFEEKELTVLDGASIGEVIQKLTENNTNLLEVQDKLLYAINEKYCSSNTELNDKDILAIFPPVSGG